MFTQHKKGVYTENRTKVIIDKDGYIDLKRWRESRINTYPILVLHIVRASNHKFTRKPFERNQDIISKLSSVCSISLQKSSLIISDTSNTPSLLELRLCSALCSSSNLLMYEFISSMFTSGMELVSLDLGFFSGSPGDRSALISSSTSLHRLLYSSTLFCF